MFNKRPPLVAALAFAALLASPALTQPSGGTSTLTADLDRDGRAETFQLSDNGESLTTLIIKAPGKPEIRAAIRNLGSDGPVRHRRAQNSQRLF